MANQLSFTSLVTSLAFFGIGLSGSAQDPNHASLEGSKLAVVRVSTTERSHSGVGVIVTAEGHVLLRGAPHLDGEELFVFLTGGQRVTGRLLAWTEEWNLSIAKIAGRGPFPFATLDEKPVRTGQTCLLAGYTLGERNWSKDPLLREIAVTSSDPRIWFGSDPPSSPADGPYSSYGPVFDRAGGLIGFLGAQGSGHWAYLNANRIRILQDALLMAKNRNMDKQRLEKPAIANEQTRPYSVVSPADIEPREAQRKAVASSVRICDLDMKSKGSGVIISPDGFIASCGHGYDLAGSKVIIQLADGRDVSGYFVGVNPITDIALLKIVDEGRWPYSPIADSSRLRPETPCWGIGYPKGRLDRTPLVRETTVVLVEKPAFHILYTDQSVSFEGGDSGCGVFDTHGRLLGIHYGNLPNGKGGQWGRIETLRIQWDVLLKQSATRRGD